MAVKIGHASINERGTINKGQAGDQTGGEVCIRDWYQHEKGWVVIRCAFPSMAEKIAEAMEKICNNPCFGYAQDKRSTGITEAKKVGYDPAMVTTMCDLDCSSAVRLCCLYAGITVGNFTTAGEKKALVNTGHFNAIENVELKNLKRGDILVTKTKGHTVVVLSNGETHAKPDDKPVVIPDHSATTKTAINKARYFNKELAGTYKTTANLHMRHGAGKNTNASMVVIPKGTKVKNYGYFSTDERGIEWLYIKVVLGGITYIGFSHEDYLRKV